MELTRQRASQELVAAMQSALGFGLQWEALAGIAVATLERWEAQEPRVLQALAPQLVPLLEPYLQKSSDQEMQPAPLSVLGMPARSPPPPPPPLPSLGGIW